MFAGELPGKQPGRDRVGGGGHVAAVAQVVPEQGGDPAGLLAVEHNQAAGDAVFEGEGVIEQESADRREPLLGGRRWGFGLGVDHGQPGAAEDALVAGPGQEG